MPWAIGLTLVISTILYVLVAYVAVMSVPIGVNPKTRDSRLFKSIPHFLFRQGTTIFRMYGMYRPLRLFTLTGSLILLVGLGAIARFLYFYFSGEGDGHVQSVVLGGTLVRRPRQIGIVVTLAIMGHHYRRVAAGL